MVRNSFAAKKAKIKKEMEKLQRQIELLESKNRQPVIDNIIRSMKEYEITPEELLAAYAKGGRVAAKTRTARKSVGAPRGPVAPKYRNPETDDKWTGRGKPPRWITEAESRGVSRDQFLIEPKEQPQPSADQNTLSLSNSTSGV